MKSKKRLLYLLESRLHFLLIGIFTILMMLYVYMSITTFDVIGMDRRVWLLISLIFSALYLYVYRRKTLFCFETLFLFIFIVSTFFNELILENLFDNSMVSSVLYTTFAPAIENKGIIIQMLALFGFMGSAAFCNSKRMHKNYEFNIEMSSSVFEKIRLNRAVNAMAVIVFVYIVYLYMSGTFASWFHYSDSSSNKAYSNLEIIYCTVLFLVFTTLEFARLYKVGCHNLSSFFLKCNKFYLIELSVVFCLLILSGNRNESLLIIVPVFAAFSIMIKPISNKVFLVGILAGSAFMIIIGLTRKGSVEDEGGVNVFTIARDFGVVDTNTRYLIQYTDKKGPIYFTNAFTGLLSTVPFLGGLVVNGLSIDNDVRSTVITTDGMQLADRMDSGLGTSLVGDLYYTASGLWVILFMSLFGFFVAYTHNRFIIEKSFSPWWFILYAFNLSNVVYYVRAEWTMPFRYIGFSFILLYFLFISYSYKTKTV